MNNTVNNGKIHNRKQKYKCQDCDRKFVENPTNKIISIDKGLLEKNSLRSIHRITGITWS